MPFSSKGTWNSNCLKNLQGSISKIGDTFQIDKIINFDENFSKYLKENQVSINSQDKKINSVAKEMKETQYRNLFDHIIPIIMGKSKEKDEKKKFSELNIKDFYFDFLATSGNYLCKNELKNCNSYFVGVEHNLIKSYIKNKLTLGNDSNSFSLDEMAKMTLKERLKYKEDQNQINYLNLYEDVKELLINEIENFNRISPKKIEINKETIFNEIVIKDVNNTILNNITQNEKFQVGILLIRNERLEPLYEMFNEFKI